MLISGGKLFHWFLWRSFVFFSICACSQRLLALCRVDHELYCELYSLHVRHIYINFQAKLYVVMIFCSSNIGIEYRVDFYFLFSGVKLPFIKNVMAQEMFGISLHGSVKPVRRLILSGSVASALWKAWILPCILH